jgi:prepilin-type N-terminal cleavage/methylation domain-containing protein
VTFLKLQKGVTLLETMLALAIGSLVLVLSLKMYRQYELDANLVQLQGNVDSLFQAMSLYYKANCFGSYDSSGAMSVWGTLNPRNPAPPSLNTPKVLTIAGSLQGANLYLRSWQPLNPLVNAAGGGESGYFIQFVPVLFNTNNMNACTDIGTKLTPCTISPRPTPSGTNLEYACSPACTVTPTPVNPAAANQVNGHYMSGNQVTGLVWKMQVSVLLLDPTKAAVFQAALQATCNSDLVAGVVEPKAARCKQWLFSMGAITIQCFT